MPVEMSWVRRDLMIFQACGTKLTVEATVAQAPMIVADSIGSPDAGGGYLVNGTVDKARSARESARPETTADRISSLDHVLRVEC
jgi:hypothetical protein